MKRDLVLVGGGLANSLIAYRMSKRRPDVDLLMVEQADRLGGNHTWSFHKGDVCAEQHAWLAPFIEHAWPHYEVEFPRLSRRLTGGYFSITSALLDQVVREALGDRCVLNASVEHLTPHQVVLGNGESIEANAVIDGRGDPHSRSLVLAFQKFLGQVVRLENAHGLEGPLLMDATVEQLDGYRFVYVLPLSERTALVEDTRYSDGPALDCDPMRSTIAQYIEARGWRLAAVEREEQGVLPIVLSGDIHAFWNESQAGLPRSGLRAALFNPITGYSLPEAVRLADDLSEADVALESHALFDSIRARSISLWNKGAFFRLLNRMLFRAAEPTQRYRVLERFYRLPAPLIERFYAGRLTLRDRIRLVTGVPPVPVHRALPCLFGDHHKEPGHSDTGARHQGT